MNKKKLIIGIDLDKFFKKSVQKNIKEFKDLPVRWHSMESYHIPIISLGWVAEDDVMDLIEVLHDFVDQREDGYVEFKKIVFVEQKNNSKKIRVVGKSSEYLRNLYIDLMDFLDIKHAEIGEFAPIVNLGHVRANAWQELLEKPEINKEFDVLYDVVSITLFEVEKDSEKNILQPIESFEFM